MDIYLGYEDEIITEKNLLDYTTNKIGGFPNWPSESSRHLTKCPICSLHRLLVVQCYAPIEKSVYHRTLYVFACINPNCWIQSESWACIRSQIREDKTTCVTNVPIQMAVSQNTWCSKADDWDEDIENDSLNGNSAWCEKDPKVFNMQGVSDEEDDSSSMEMDNLQHSLANIQVDDSHNANSYLYPPGAVGRVGDFEAAAELEGGDEPGLVTIDTPTNPTNELDLLLHRTVELPQDLQTQLAIHPLQFSAKYIYVEKEKRSLICDKRINELLHKYNRENDVAEMNEIKAGNSAANNDEEQYEETKPAHGDVMFHNFISRLKENPGHILRYSREASPLLGAPLHNPKISEHSRPPSCQRCKAPMICELQLLPEFAHSLLIDPGNISLDHLHFLSVLIFTCSESCWKENDTTVEEIVIFQPEIV